VTTDEINIRVGLSAIRKRRWYVCLVILVYFPSTWLTLELTQSYRSTAVVFGIWFVFLCTVITLFAIVRCPQCGKYFHMRNATLSFARTCRHCGLYIKGNGSV